VITGIPKKASPADSSKYVTLVINGRNLQPMLLKYERMKPLATDLESKAAEARGSISYSVINSTPAYHGFFGWCSTPAYETVKGILTLGKDYSFDGQVFHERKPVLYIDNLAKLH